MSSALSLDASGPNDLSPFGLGSETTQYEYQGVDHFLTILDHEYALFANDETGTKSQYFVFYHLSEEQFNQEFRSPSNPRLTYQSYIYHLELLFVKMVEFEPHAVAATKFDHQFIIKLNSMANLDRDIMPVRTADFYAEEVDETKRADNAYRPLRFPPTQKSTWPTLVVEVGFSEPVRRLNSDAKWWLDHSGGTVANVITISINTNLREIAIEKWAREKDEPTVKFRTVVSQEAGSNKIKISNGPLIIRFKDIFLRLPSGPEVDITFGASELEEIASKVWHAQFETDFRSHVKKPKRKRGSKDTSS